MFHTFFLFLPINVYVIFFEYFYFTQKTEKNLTHFFELGLIFKYLLLIFIFLPYPEVITL